MNEVTKARITAVLLFVSIVGIFIMSFIDFHEGLQIFQLGNPFIDEDWILTITSIIVLVISINNVSSIMGRLDTRRKTYNERFDEQHKRSHFYLWLMGLYLLMATISFIDFKAGAAVLKKHFIDSQLRKDEDAAIAVISLISFVKFYIDYKKAMKKMSAIRKKMRYK